MTKEQIRIAMAEVDGWKPTRHKIKSYPTWGHPDGGRRTFFQLPNYAGSLDTCASVFAKLPFPEQQEVVWDLAAAKPSSSPCMAVAFSVASDWCESILRVKGRWVKETKEGPRP